MNPQRSAWIGGAAVVLLGLVFVAFVAVAATPAVDARGWTVGPNVQKASGFAQVLRGGGPFAAANLHAPLIGTDGSAVDLNEIITRPTLLFYFSPGCHHCRAVGPELAELHSQQGEAMDFLAIASGGSSSPDIEAFMAEFKLPFPAYKDFARKVARGIEATSTPTVLIVEPTEGGGFRTLFEFRPFGRGSALILQLQQAAARGEDPFSVFEPHRFYGAKVCGSCHIQEVASWTLTHHSVAYWTLYSRKQAEDLACVGCHVTGMGQQGGFTPGDHESVLTDVTCEACHGAGGPHSGNRQSRDQLRAVCIGCHDAKHSIGFDLDRALPHIDHYRAASLSPEDFRATREAILDGSAPRPLLAFPEGDNLGSEACLACHKAVGRTWKKSAHAKARNSLKKKGSASDDGCLSCHAVAKPGNESEAPSFHSGGVGCESCHGPGEQHVAAGGGKENIVGLGETCPECVIETICTRCHTPEHDPDWDLKVALPKVGHGLKP
jgi:thiol-disulfide isomerase/thioredoxin